VGCVARLDPWKGIEIFVQAAAEIARSRPDAHFLVCGGELPGYEPYAAEIRALAAELGLGDRVHFTGWTYSLDDIPEVMAALDVLLHTPIRPEPFGLVIVEAMATAKPVVASADGGIMEILQDGVTGRLIRPGDASGMATAVLDLLDDPMKARAFGRAGRERVERDFEVGAYAGRIQALYDDILGSHGR
jgi:glycosyltransferase involved in cell wall biosynthesis